MKPNPEVVSPPEGFAEFLHGLTLESIVIENCSATVRDGKIREAKGAVATKMALAFAYEANLVGAEPSHCIVSAFHGVRVVPEMGADTNEAWMAQLDVEYLLRYKTKAKMTQEFFEQFKAVTLRLNTVPFAREWIHSTSVKMGLKPIILPLAVSVDNPRSKPRRARKAKLLNNENEEV